MKLLLECVPRVLATDVLDLSGVLLFQVPFDIEGFRELSNDAKKQCTLDILHGGVLRVAQREGWPSAPFEEARERVLAKRLQNEGVWKTPRWSARRRYRAHMWCSHEIDAFRAWLVIETKDGVELVRKQLLETTTSHFDYGFKLGQLKWTSDHRVTLFAKWRGGRTPRGPLDAMMPDRRCRILNDEMTRIPDDAAGDTLRRLAAGGSDIGRPMEVEFCVAVPDQRAGEAVAAAAEEAGFSTKVVCDDELGTWICCCARRMVPEHAALLASEAQLDAIGRRHGGWADGFGSFGNVDEVAGLPLLVDAHPWRCLLVESPHCELIVEAPDLEHLAADRRRWAVLLVVDGALGEERRHALAPRSRSCRH